MNAGPVLRDIHLPEAPGLWPPAPGWWLLAALLLVLLALAARRGWRAWRRRRRMRALDALLREAAARHAGAGDGAALAAELSLLLRRAARLAGTPAAALQGEAWLRFLDGDDPRRPFSSGAGRLLLEAPFRASASRGEVAALLPLVRARLHTLGTAGG